MPNFYRQSLNLPTLQVRLLERGVIYTGTVRVNCKHLPKQDAAADKHTKLGDASCFPAQKLMSVKLMGTKQSTCFLKTDVHILCNK